MILTKDKLFKLLPLLDLSIQLKFRTLSEEDISSLFPFSEEMDAMLLSSKAHANSCSSHHKGQVS